MNPHPITPPVTKMRTYRTSADPFKSPALPKLIPQQPVHFAAALAHEVRNPLSNINLAVEMLKSTTLGKEQQLFLDIIMRSSGRISGLIADLLSSVQSDEIKLEKYSVDQLLDEVLAMTKDKIKLKNIIIRKDYTTLDCKILVNKHKMKMALTNIIINAIESMYPEKGILKLATRSMNGQCIIEIKDNGIGIPKANLDKIFQPYFTNKAGGMGLGLSTTLDILRSNRAKVDVQSEEGKGTRFLLTFDRLQASGKC